MLISRILSERQQALFLENVEELTEIIYVHPSPLWTRYLQASIDYVNNLILVFPSGGEGGVEVAELSSGEGEVRSGVTVERQTDTGESLHGPD